MLQCYERYQEGHVHTPRLFCYDSLDSRPVGSRNRRPNEMRSRAKREREREIQRNMQVKRSFSFKLINRHAKVGSGQLMGKEFFYYCLLFQGAGASSPMV